MQGRQINTAHLAETIAKIPDLPRNSAFNLIISPNLSRPEPTFMSEKTVFISYSHDSDEHRENVLALSERLRLAGC